MSFERGDQGQCVLCSSELITAVVSNQNQHSVNSGMKNQVRAIFVLRKLLRISNSTCCDLLQFGNPSTWLSYCFECFETVIEAEKVFSKLMKLERKWADLKKSVEEKICKQNYPSQITRKFFNVRNSEIFSRIREEAVDKFRLLNSERIDLNPPTSKARVKIEIEDDEYFDDLIDNDYQSDEEDSIITQSSTNSVLQNNENGEQDCSRVKMPTSKRTEYIQSKNEVGRRTRSGRMTISKYVSNLNCDDVKDDYEPKHDLDGNDDNSNLMGPIKSSKNIQCPQCDRVFQHPCGLNYHQRLSHVSDSEKRFRCEICGLGLDLRRSLYKHIEKKHSGQTATGTRSCYKCSSKFCTKSELMDHVCKPTNEVFECKKCGKRYDSVKGLERHSKSHWKEISTKISKFKGDLKFKCHKCSRAFSSLISRRYHTLRTHVSGKETPYPCGKCEKGFHTRRNLRIHDVKHHNGLPFRPKNKIPKVPERKHRERNVPCPQCEFLFSSQNMVESHIRKVHDSNFRVSCPVCSKQLQSTSKLNDHLRNVHRKEKNFICEICSKPFIYASTLRQHQMSQHEKSELLKCQQCDHFAASTASLKKHIAVVHNKSSLKFKCPVCSYVAISQSILNTHILGRHTHEKPFACTECDKSYVSGGSLKIHMRSHTGERPFECQFCQKRFYTNVKRKTHEEDMHSTEKAFQCEKCGKNFPSKHYLQTHIYDVHRKRQKDPVPEKILINSELLKDAISQNTAEIVKTNVVGLILEKTLQNP